MKCSTPAKNGLANVLLVCMHKCAFATGRSDKVLGAHETTTTNDAYLCQSSSTWFRTPNKSSKQDMPFGDAI
jgi:hypothetical protein